MQGARGSAGLGMRGRWWGVGVVAAVGLMGPLAGVAGAETVATTCKASWWVPGLALPASFTGMPAQPTVLLPAVWAEVEGVPPGGEALYGLEVVVKAVGGGPVEGELGVGVVEPLPEATGGPAFLPRQLYWRPSGALAAGSYEATVTVAPPPEADDSWDCYYQGFERSVTFEVAAEAVVPATLDIEARLTVRDGAVVKYGTECTRADAVACEGAPEVCCWHEHGAGARYGFEATVTPSGLAAGGPYHHLLTIRKDPLVGIVGVQVEHRHPVSDGVPVVLESGFTLSSKAFEWPSVDEFCVEAELTNLALGEVVAAGKVCAPSASPQRDEPLPPLVCERKGCDAALHGEPVEPEVPGPEEVAEPGPEATAEPVGPAGDVVAGDDTTTTPDAEGGRSGRGGSCAGGGAAGGALVASAAGGLLAWRRRRTR